MDTKYKLVKLLLIASIVAEAIVFSACGDKVLSVKDSATSIPIERTGLNGEYDLNGLAKRVVSTLKKDLVLSNISTIYIAQNNSKIIVKGEIANKTFLNRLVAVTRNVRGVSDVDVSQVTIRNQVW